MQYDQLKALMLSGRSVSPTVEILIQQSAPLDLSKMGIDEPAWRDSSRAKDVPTPLGFVPSAARGDLFALAKPNYMMALGDIDLSFSPELRFHFSVENDGSAVSDITPLQQSGLRTLVVKDGDRKGSAIVFVLKVDSKIDSLKLFDGLVKAYDRKDAPLAVRVFTDVCSKFGHSRAARVSIGLGNEIAVVALLHEDSPTCGSDGTTYYIWRFEKPPELVVKHL